MKPKLKQVIAKPNNTSIIIYYSKGGKEMRFSTGISISNKKLKNGNYADWDYSRNLVKTNLTDHKEMNKKIEKLIQKANSTLASLFEKGITPYPEVLESYLLAEETFITATNESLVTKEYERFHKVKEEQFSASGSIISLKDFTSTKNLINDFQIYKKETYSLYQLNLSWFKNMLNFMKIPHKDDPKEQKKYKTHGNLGAKTIRKRFDVFIQFAEHLKSEKMCQQELIDDIKGLRKSIKTPTTGKTTLKISEIFKLYDYNFNGTEHEEIRDVFVFLCFTGLRYSDYLIFDSKFITKSELTQDLVYTRTALKTKESSGLNYQIPMCNIVLEILKKYDNKLPNVPNPNKKIKDALKATNLFDDFTQRKDKATNKEKTRYDCISMHKGRDTFITNLVDVTPLNQLMKYTGHSKLTTLQGYIDKSRDVDTNPIKIFNR